MTNTVEDTTTFRHCDEYIDDPTTPEVVRAFLKWARSPAHGLLLPRPWPELYATYHGQRVRVTMASRIGDVGISERLHAETGYHARVLLEHLTDFKDTP